MDDHDPQITPAPAEYTVDSDVDPEPAMKTRVSDEELWSWVDRDAPELEAYLREHPDERLRVDDLCERMEAVARAAGVPAPTLPRQIGPYRVLDLLGAGGMGVVYRAEQQSPRREVAVKVMRTWGTGDGRRQELLERECDALGRLTHPAIATIHEAGRTPEGLPYLVMECVRGQPLGRHVQAAGSARRERLNLFLEVCRGVEAAHRAGIVHRDLKPGNILVDEEGRPRVLDFGLALFVDEMTTAGSITRTGRLVGTLPYMSPEQVRGSGDRLDRRTDVYSLGVILYELLCGRLPHDVVSRSLPASVAAICDDPPPRPRTIDATLGGPLEAIMLKALEKDPARRYPSAGPLADDIERFLAGDAVAARPPDLLRRTREVLRRHRWPVALAGVTLPFVIALAVVLAGREPDPSMPAGGAASDTLGALASRGPLRVAPFDELRWAWSGPEIAHEGRWYGLEAVNGQRAQLLIERARQLAGDGWQAHFEASLMDMVAEFVPEAPPDRADLTLRPMSTARAVVVRDVPLDGDSWTRLMSVSRPPPPPSPVLDPENRHDDDGYPALSPFTAVRWHDDRPEVRFEGGWYQPIEMFGLPVGEILEGAQRLFDDRWRRRFSDDLVQLLVLMGHKVERRIALKLRELKSGAVREIDSAPMTAANRRQVMEFERQQEGRNR